MTNKKDLIIAVLATFCLTATLFSIIPVRSQQPREYDPRLDVTGPENPPGSGQFPPDGVINMRDIGYICSLFMTTGTPINWTKLQDDIDELKARVSELEANYSVTDLKLAPYAIPFNSTFSTSYTGTTETMNWVDMSAMSVIITLNRTSHLLIMFSSEAENTAEGNSILLRALVGGVVALPGAITLTPVVWDYAFTYDIQDNMAYTYNFYKPSVSAGTYTIKIQWMVTGGTGYAYYRTLMVIALPA